ncbi:MAG TPA: DapH/DapD/GlmU-related protein, partial [Beutenbergiaceae bacterium]|nr:DapH/DapD/GlmU-related protein [Beutenbergiaceae bacterium]
GPCSPSGFEQVRLHMRIAAKGAAASVHAVSKIPPMTDYVLPDDVAIADASRVRLGAYLAPGTRVTHEGFVDAGAATEGGAYIQGRLSRGVSVGEGSHVGGSASLLPASTDHPMRIGKNCLIGANSGVGVSLGDRCIVEAGLFLTPGTKITIRTGADPHARVVSARDLAGESNLLFRRNSTTGVVEAFDRGRASPD